MVWAAARYRGLHRELIC